MSDDLRLAAVAARVVAWHNRHPLARRIAAAQVHAVGYVGLPFVGAAGVAVPASADALPPADAATAGGAEPVDLTAPEAEAPEAGTLRERALARARQQAATPGSVAPGAAPNTTLPTPDGGAAAAATDAAVPPLATLQPDFSEDFIDPLRPRAVARFAACAGQVLARAPDDGPVRQVLADGAHPGRLAARVYLLTAVIETGTRKSRVLLGTGLAAPVLGHRVFSRLRLGALAGLASLVVVVPAWLLQAAPEPPAVHTVPPVAAAPTAATAATAAAAADGSVPTVVAHGPSQAASEAGATAVAAAASAPTDVPPAPAPAVEGAHETTRPGSAASAAAPEAPKASGPDKVRTAGALSIRPVISEADKARARQARQARPAAPTPRPAAARAPPEAPPQHTAQVPTPAPTPAPAAAPALPAPGSAAFALSTRPLRTRAEAEQLQVAMRSLLRTIGAGEMKVDVLPQGDDWRVVALPFPRRADADKARTLLVSRGMRVEVVDF